MARVGDIILNLKIVRTSTGFTLIELMIVVAIIGIIAAIAYPNYTKSVQKSRRADAMVMLANVASVEERILTKEGQYSDILGNLNAHGTHSENDYYDLTVAINGASKNVVANYEDTATGSPATRTVAITCGGSRCFVLAAAAKGSQAQDTECLIVTLDSVGRKRSFNATGENALGTCWK